MYLLSFKFSFIRNFLKFSFVSDCRYNGPKTRKNTVTPYTDIPTSVGNLSNTNNVDKKIYVYVMS